MLQDSVAKFDILSNVAGSYGGKGWSLLPVIEGSDDNAKRAANTMWLLCIKDI